MTNTKRLAYAIYDIMQTDAWSAPKEIAASFIGREFIYDICHEHERNGRCRSWTEYGFTPDAHTVAAALAEIPAIADKVAGY